MTDSIVPHDRQTSEDGTRQICVPLCAVEMPPELQALLYPGVRRNPFHSFRAIMGRRLRLQVLIPPAHCGGAPLWSRIAALHAHDLRPNDGRSPRARADRDSCQGGWLNQDWLP
jgi:hypothetical protein